MLVHQRTNDRSSYAGYMALSVKCSDGIRVTVPATDVASSTVLNDAAAECLLRQPGDAPLDLQDINATDLRLWMADPSEAQSVGVGQALKCLEVACRLNADCEKWASGAQILCLARPLMLWFMAVHGCSWVFMAVCLLSLIEEGKRVQPSGR